MQNIKISLIIPVYNVEKYIEKCISSCLQQDISTDEYEIIIVDDGTPDDSMKIVRDKFNNIKNIIIVSQINQGLSEARNAGLKKARGEYIWYIDSDDWIESNCLRKITTICKSNNLDILAIPAIEIVNDENIVRMSYKNDENIVYRGADFLLKGIVSVCAPLSIYKRTFLIENKLSFYPHIFHEDSEFTPRAYYRAQSVMCIDLPFYYIFIHQNSITTSINPQKAIDIITVCQNLDAFNKTVEKKHQKEFYAQISVNMNNSLYLSYENTNSDNLYLGKLFFENRYLFKNLIKSDILKYKIEGFLFNFFPKKCICIYKMLHLLKYKH
ncbi:MAG: glycosyltransferase [Muribaculaceae bacterium]